MSLLRQSAGLSIPWHLDGTADCRLPSRRVPTRTQQHTLSDSHVVDEYVPEAIQMKLSLFRAFPQLSLVVMIVLTEFASPAIIYTSQSPFQ